MYKSPDKPRIIGWFKNGAPMWSIAGASEPAPEPPANPPTPPATAPEKTLTQAEVSAIAAREKAEGARAAEERLAKDLGVTIAEAKDIIAKHKAKAESEKTEAEKAREAADREKAEAEREKAETAKERHNLKVERALMRAGIDPGDEDARLIRAVKVLDVEVGADDAAIKAAVDSLKKDEPSWFGEKAVPPKKGPAAPPSDPPGNPPSKPISEDKFTAGMERAKNRGHHGRAYPQPAGTVPAGPAT